MAVADPTRSRFAMIAPVVEALLFSVSGERIDRLGGYDAWTLADLAREYRDGSGDAGICFEFAVHEAIAARNDLIWPLASEVLESFCGIGGGADSLLFGPEKNGRIPILESVRDALTDEARVYVGNRGQPPKLKRYIPQIINAFYRNEARNKLPRSIRGLWKADLFIGNPESEKWVGTTVKSNPTGLEGAQGLRLGIYPKKDARDCPRRDDDLNLVRLPLPYDGAFMEIFYMSFYLVRAFLLADAQVPRPVELPHAEDRFLTLELERRRTFPIMDVLEVIRGMSQPGLLRTEGVQTKPPTAALSKEGLDEQPADELESGFVSLSPIARNP